MVIGVNHTTETEYCTSTEITQANPRPGVRSKAPGDLHESVSHYADRGVHCQACAVRILVLVG